MAPSLRRGDDSVWLGGIFYEHCATIGGSNFRDPIPAYAGMTIKSVRHRRTQPLLSAHCSLIKNGARPRFLLHSNTELVTPGRDILPAHLARN